MNSSSILFLSGIIAKTGLLKTSLHQPRISTVVPLTAILFSASSPYDIGAVGFGMKIMAGGTLCLCHPAFFLVAVIRIMLH